MCQRYYSEIQSVLDLEDRYGRCITCKGTIICLCVQMNPHDIAKKLKYLGGRTRAEKEAQNPRHNEKGRKFWEFVAALCET